MFKFVSLNNTPNKRDSSGKILNTVGVIVYNITIRAELTV